MLYGEGGNKNRHLYFYKCRNSIEGVDAPNLLLGQNHHLARNFARSHVLQCLRSIR